jgi:hypothetical protein
MDPGPGEFRMSENDINHWVVARGAPLIKGLVLAAMTLFAVAVTVSIWKGLVLAAFVFCIAQFGVLRRYAELPVMVLFICCAFYWCAPELFSSISTSLKFAMH